MYVKKYFDHYVEMPDFIIFLLLTFCILAVVVFIFYLYSKGKVKNKDPEEISEKFASLSEKFYELIYSGTSILFFMTVYYLIDRFFDVEPYKSVMVKYNNFLLLLLIILSCVINTFLDKLWTRLRAVSKEERSSIRLIGMLYMLLIFMYIKYIYENNNYDMFISYFLGLVIGRFVYFDASLKDFGQTIKKAFANIPIMLIALACTGALSWYGFSTKYLVKHIGVVTNVFIEHLFMCVCVFIIFHLHPEKWIPKKKDPKVKGRQDDTCDEFEKEVIKLYEQKDN